MSALLNSLNKLKDYNYVILWLDYFNKNLSRRKGRKIKRDHAVFDPSVKELADAAKAAGFELPMEQINDQARFPRRPFVKSGYVMLPKMEGTRKPQIIDSVAEKMLKNRNRQQKGTQK